jgi:hypothetical protein
MPILRPRVVLSISLIAGILAGAIVAVAVPRTGGDPQAPRVPVHRIAAPLPPAPGRPGLRDTTTPRIVLTARDPAGGPDWALRRISGSYALPKDLPRHRIGRELLGRQDCLQLGRLVGGHFGWLDGAGTFRRAPTSAAGMPSSCHPHGAARHAARDAQLLTWVTHPDFGEPRPAATLVWGPAPAGARDVKIESDGKRRTARQSADGAFLAFLPARAAAPRDLHVTATDAAGHAADLYSPPAFSPPGVPKVAPGRLTARTFDPSGGASWGVATARTADGRWCFTNGGRVVDATVGALDARLDLFSDQSQFAYNCAPAADSPTRNRPLTRQLPLMYAFTEGGVAAEQRPGGSAGRIALRTQPNATVFFGLARPDVRTITVTTPSQTRVIRPTGAGHAFVVAVDGEFPSGHIELTSTFTDGVTATQGDVPGR